MHPVAAVRRQRVGGSAVAQLHLQLIQLRRFVLMWLCTTAVSTWAMGHIDDWFGLKWAWLAKPGVDPKRMRISAYWKRGAADHHEDLVSAAG